MVHGLQRLLTLDAESQENFESEKGKIVTFGGVASIV